MKRGHLDNLQNVVHPTVVGIVFWMEKGGYLICYMDREDRRNKAVAVTELARFHLECSLWDALMAAWRITVLQKHYACIGYDYTWAILQICS